MSTKTTVVAAQTNFRRRHYEIHKNTDAAKRILRDPRRLSWFEGVRREPGQKTEFKLNIWICPYCGTAHPEYQKDCSFDGAIAEEQMEDFFDEQTSLFGDEKVKTIHFQAVNTDDGAHICRKCDRFSTSDSDPTIVIFQRTKTRSRNELKVTLLHVPFKDLFNMAGLTGFRVEDADPRASFTESIVYNFKRGNVFLTLEEEDYMERRVAIRDITNSIWSDGPLFRAVFLHPQMNRRFYEQFNDAYPGKNPFSREEMTPMHYVHLCRFQGFSQNFYESIPFSLDQSVTMEIPFRSVARKLHTRDKAIAMVKRELPYDSKEIRRIMFLEMPGFMFYLRELKTMGEVLCVTVEDLRHMKRYVRRDESQLQDLSGRISRDLFVQFLRLPSAIPIASKLKAYPGTKEYLNILLKQVGSRRMLSLLKYSSLPIFAMGERYACASPYEKKVLLNKGIGLCKKELPWNSLVSTYSEQVSKNVIGDLKEVYIRNYRFKPVTYTQEYSIAADQLHNCLRSWCTDRNPNPVVIVYYQFKIVAAIEVCLKERTVFQAHLSHNREMSDDPALYSAYKKWLGRSGFKEFEYEY